MQVSEEDSSVTEELADKYEVRSGGIMSIEHVDFRGDNMSVYTNGIKVSSYRPKKAGDKSGISLDLDDQVKDQILKAYAEAKGNVKKFAKSVSDFLNKPFTPRDSTP